MNVKLSYWAAVIFSALSLILLVVDISLASANRARQAEVAARQGAIMEGQALGQVNQGVVQALAEATIKSNDLALRDLLVSQGITLKTDAKSDEKADKNDKK